MSEGKVFDGLKNATHIYGDKVKPKDLNGRVVFLEYWGINCPPCRASFPHLVKLQKKYAKTGKFTILASHVQNDPEKAKEFCKQQKVNFPVFQQFREPKAPCGRGIPSAALIDHTGKVVETGHPTALYKKVAKLVKAAPEPPAAILGGVEVKFWERQAKVLASGKPVAPVLRSLKKAAKQDSPKGKEAGKIVEAVNNYLEEQQKLFTEMIETEPSLALKNLKTFLIQVKGLKMEKKLKVEYTKLNTDPFVKKLLLYRLELEKINARLAKRDSRSLRRKLELLKLKLGKFAENSSTDNATAEEAKKSV